MATPQYLAKTDFKGVLKIDFGNYDQFDDLAAKIETDYMTKLFGVYLRNTVSLKSGLSYQVSGDYYEIHGTTEMLKYFFYFHYMTEHHTEMARTDKIEEIYSYAVGGQKARMNRLIVNNWNTAVDYYNEIIDYVNYQISQGSTDYEGFNPVILEKINEFGL